MLAYSCRLLGRLCGRNTGQSWGQQQGACRGDRNSPNSTASIPPLLRMDNDSCSQVPRPVLNGSGVSSHELTPSQGSVPIGNEMCRMTVSSEASGVKGQ